MTNPTTVQKVVVTITPKDKDGVVVDLAKFPDAVVDVVFSAAQPAAIKVLSLTQVELTSSAVGDVVLTVTATNVVGAELSETVTVTFDQATPTVATLNPVAGDPVAA